MALTCDDNRLMGLGVAPSLPLLAPRLAPRTGIIDTENPPDRTQSRIPVGSGGQTVVSDHAIQPNA